MKLATLISTIREVAQLMSSMDGYKWKNFPPKNSHANKRQTRYTAKASRIVRLVKRNMEADPPSAAETLGTAGRGRESFGDESQ